MSSFRIAFKLLSQGLIIWCNLCFLSTSSTFLHLIPILTRKRVEMLLYLDWGGEHFSAFWKLFEDHIPLWPSFWRPHANSGCDPSGSGLTHTTLHSPFRQERGVITVQEHIPVKQKHQKRAQSRTSEGYGLEERGLEWAESWGPGRETWRATWGSSYLI